MKILFSKDKSLLDKEMIYKFLSENSYWAKGIPREIVYNSIKNSECFGGYIDGKQVAFARLITDYSVYGYITDVFVVERHRGEGIGKKLMNFILNQAYIKKLRRIELGTHDAHELYRKFGFEVLECPERKMEKKISHYKNKN